MKPIYLQVANGSSNLVGYHQQFAAVRQHVTVTVKGSQPDQRVFFAGEATNKAYFGTAHGAYLSGLRATGEMLAA